MLHWYVKILHTIKFTSRLFYIEELFTVTIRTCVLQCLNNHFSSVLYLSAIYFVFMAHTLSNNYDNNDYTIRLSAQKEITAEEGHASWHHNNIIVSTKFTAGQTNLDSCELT